MGHHRKESVKTNVLLTQESALTITKGRLKRAPLKKGRKSDMGVHIEDRESRHMSPLIYRELLNSGLAPVSPSELLSSPGSRSARNYTATSALARSGIQSPQNMKSARPFGIHEKSKKSKGQNTGGCCGGTGGVVANSRT